MFLTHLLNLVYPKVCMGCHSMLLSDEKVICTSCRHEIPLTQHHLNPENEVFKRFYGRVTLEHASALFYYHKKGIVQELIHNLKYRGHEEIGTMVGEWMSEDLKNIALSQKFDAIIPVPLHKKRLKERGYNQVTTFGLGLSGQLNIPFNPTVLRRNVYSKTQVKKNLLGRTEITAELFDVVFTEENHNQHFLVIDDVITTGSTLEACCKALLKIPGAKISIVCMALSHS